MPSLHDMILRHRLYLDGLLLQIKMDFNDTAILLDRAVKRVFADVEVKSIGDLTKRQFDDLIRDLLANSEGVLNDYISELDKAMQTFIAIERKMYQSMFRNATDDTIAAVSAASLWATIRNSNLAASGATYTQHQEAFHDAALAQLEKATRTGYANNSETDDVVTSIRGTNSRGFRDGVFEKLNKWSGAMTGTLFAHASATVNHDIGEANFDQYTWVSIIDDVTTDVCFDRDGNVYTYGKGPIPPAHYNCRSEIVPFIEGESPPTDFASWLDTQPDNILGDIFGSRRPVLANVKAITFDQFKSKLEFILA
jgi:SPP1 gp7 family putative phage head morphogenesis protein